MKVAKLNVGDIVTWYDYSNKEYLKTRLIALNKEKGLAIVEYPKSKNNALFFRDNFDINDDDLNINVWCLPFHRINEVVKSERAKQKDFGYWLSGIDQYSEENYNRGDSGLEWL